MNLNMQSLFDNLSEGLLIISALECEVVYANQAAISMLPVVIGKPLAGGWMKSRVHAIQRGYIKPPHVFEPELPEDQPAGDQIAVTLLRSPVGNDFIAILKNKTAERTYENVIKNLAEMLDCEYRMPMHEFLGAVAQLLNRVGANTQEGWALRESVDRISRLGASLEERLQRISLMASAFRETPMRGDDRIKLPVLIDDALLLTKSLLMEQGIRISYSGINDGLPAIYGSKDFLVQALAGYIRCLVECVNRGAVVQISARVKGDFILLSIEDYGRTRTAQSGRIPLPLSAVGEAGSVDPMRLTLPLCKRVVELNGGSLAVENNGIDINKITFELPIGGPSVNDREFGIQQAQRYAQDLHTMMQRRATGTKH